MRALVPVAVVAILAVTFLIVWLTQRRRAVRRGTLHSLRRENDRLRDLVIEIQRETTAQLAAGNGSHGYTAELITDFSRKGTLS